MDNNNTQIFWDKKLNRNEVKNILKDELNPRFVEFASLLLSRTNKPKNVFGKYLTQEIFVNNWAKIKRRMRENKWSDSRIIFWDEIYRGVIKKTNFRVVREFKDRPLDIDPEIKELSDVIKDQRRKNGLTQVQLADKAGLSQQAISFAERGYVNISLRTLKKISDALNLRIVLEEKGGFEKE
jgi:HTH-type transcriptional regulator / antitoxin HipB